MAFETTETTLPLGPALEVDESPLPVLVVAEDVGEVGQAVNLTASFPDTAPQITAVAFANDAGTVAVTWFQVPDEGDPTELFSHEVAVESGQIAFSKGTSPGVLAAGTYRIEAKLDEDEEVVEFSVETPQAGGDAAPGTAGRAAQAPGTTGPPQSGERCARASALPIDVVDRVAAFLRRPLQPPSPDARVVSFGLYFVVAQPTEAEVPVAGSGQSLTRRLALEPGTSPPSVDLDLDPCRLGNDLPDARGEFSVRFLGGAEVSVLDEKAFVNAEVAPGSATLPFRLGPDTTDPVITTSTGSLPGSSPNMLP